MNNSKLLRFVNYSFVITTIVAVIAVFYSFFTQDHVTGISSFVKQLEVIIMIYVAAVFTPLAVLYITCKEYGRALAERRFTHFFTSLLNGILISAGISIVSEAFLLMITRIFNIQCRGEFCDFGLILFFILPLVIGSIFTFIFALLFHLLSQRNRISYQTTTETTSVINNYSVPKSRVMWYIFLFIIVILSIFLLLWLTLGASHRWKYYKNQKWRGFLLVSSSKSRHLPERSRQRPTKKCSPLFLIS